jgi:cell wall-associated NlpC family hydrolase
MGERDAAPGLGMTGPERVVAHARQMLDVRWRHQGRKAWAVDCLGLVELCLITAGWPGSAQTPARYGREPWDDQLRRGLQAHFGDPVTEEWKPGDVPLFRWGKGEPSHVGILCDYRYGGVSIIHASALAKKVIETSLSGRLRECVIEVYRPEWGDA